MEMDIDMNLDRFDYGLPAESEDEFAAHYPATDLGRPTCKTIIVGDDGVGKSTLLRHCGVGESSRLRQMAIGIAFEVTQLCTAEGEVRLSLWELGGVQRFATQHPSFYRGARAAVLVYDVTNRDSFFGLPSWLDQLRAELPPLTPLLLVGNKLDLIATRGRAISAAQATLFAHQHRLIYGETSALTGTGISWLLEALGHLAISSQ
jgi:small GTP-binding protein